MQIQCLPGAPPPPAHALIVCAGTVTCKTVSEMGSGFKVFKDYFSRNQHSNPESHKGWQEDLQQQLTGYQYGRKLPLYLRIAQQDSYLGGIATVADVSTRQMVVNPQHATMNQSQLEEQYKSAVRFAIDDALTLGRLLYIQPLGIGVYGWNPKLAATLFGEVLAEFQSTSLNIHIPIFDQRENSNDQQFAVQLQADIARGLRINVRTQPPREQPQALARAKQPSRRHTTTMSWSFVLKCLAATCALTSASLLVVTLLASISLITLTAGTIFLCGSTGVGSGICTYALFRAAKLAQNIERLNDSRHTP